jgi:hypothetical protein
LLVGVTALIGGFGGAGGCCALGAAIQAAPSVSSNANP